MYSSIPFTLTLSLSLSLPSLSLSHFVLCLSVQFMLEMIDESLIINGMNIVEEVPKVLKVLG